MSVSAIAVVLMTVFLFGILKRYSPEKTFSIVVTQATLVVQLFTLALVFVVLMLKGTFYFIH